MRAQSAVDRFMGNSYDLVIDGESYRPKQKPVHHATTAGQPAGQKPRR
jgi:hypothetical protein